MGSDIVSYASGPKLFGQRSHFSDTILLHQAGTGASSEIDDDDD